jgi:hypothetical protein
MPNDTEKELIAAIYDWDGPEVGQEVVCQLDQSKHHPGDCMWWDMLPASVRDAWESLSREGRLVAALCALDAKIMDSAAEAWAAQWE